MANGQWQNNQYTFDDGKKAVNDKYQFNGVGLGGSYQTYLFSDYTVFFGGINIKESKIKSYTLGTSLNWIYDPLVLTLSLGYLDGISRERFSNNYTAYTTGGSVIFAVNPEVNIRWGFSKDFIYTQNNLLSQKSWSSNTSLLIGTIVNLTDRVSTDINIKGGVGNNKISTVSVSLSYKI
ncbi:hypothetical protein [Photorhabdus sp. CRCIA-P01]|uniref:hypothetical protein n=1 Tax=Photorhabdus sp. CRCIA-P01 TaxID=2019570 RepID=UPI000E59D9D2|nr:hypothetical protein [Photorhabdus sp. CRCIA-P01]